MAGFTGYEPVGNPTSSLLCPTLSLCRLNGIGLFISSTLSSSAIAFVSVIIRDGVADLSGGLRGDVDLSPASPDMNRWVKCLETVCELRQLTAAVNHARIVNSINTLRGSSGYIDSPRKFAPCRNRVLERTQTL